MHCWIQILLDESKTEENGEISNDCRHEYAINDKDDVELTIVEYHVHDSFFRID